MSGDGRQARIERKTKETEVAVQLNLDGTGGSKVQTPIPFFSHMLEAWAKHGLMDLAVEATGDVDVDIHHTVEDVGIVLGQTLREALGDKRGIVRYGNAFVPMDEALLQASVDLSGRPYLVFSVPVARTRVSNFDLDMLQEFFLELGYAVDVATTGDEAVRRASSKRPDAVILDMRLPDTTGDQLLTRLRTLDGSVPIVMLSGDTDDDVARRTVAAGAFQYLQKPFDFELLQQTITRAVVAGREHHRLATVGA